MSKGYSVFARGRKLYVKINVLVETTRLLGAGLVQSDESAAISANKEWRRRESNMGALSLADAARERFRRVAHDRRSTSDEERQGTAPSLVQSACDLGLALLRVSAPNRRRRRASSRAS